MRVARFGAGLVLVVLLAAQCSSSTPDAVPDSSVSQSSADTSAASEVPADNGSAAGDPDATAADTAVASVPDGVPDGFPYDCRDESLRFVWAVSYGDRTQGVGERGELLWESTGFAGVVGGTANPQTDDYYLDDRGLVDRQTGDIAEQYDGGSRRAQFEDCSVAFEGYRELPLRRLAPNGFTMWEAPAHQGSQYDTRQLTGITPSTVIASAAHDNVTSEIFDANDGSILWTRTFDDNDLRPVPGHDIIVHDDDGETYLDARTGDTLYAMSDGIGYVCGNILWWRWRSGFTTTGYTWFDIRTGEELGSDPSISHVEFVSRGNMFLTGGSRMLEAGLDAAGTSSIVARNDGVTILPDCTDPLTEIPTEITRVSDAAATDRTVAIDHSGGTSFVDLESGALLFESEPFASVVGATESAFFLKTDSGVTLRDDRTGDVLATFEGATGVVGSHVGPHVSAPIITVFVQGGGVAPVEFATGKPLNIN